MAMELKKGCGTQKGLADKLKPMNQPMTYRLSGLNAALGAPLGRAHSQPQAPRLWHGAARYTLRG
jgi:hypothetical protein